MISDDKMTNVPVAELGSRLMSYSLGLLSTLGLAQQPSADGSEMAMVLVGEPDLPRALMLWGLLREALAELEQATGFDGEMVMRELARDPLRPHHLREGASTSPVGWMPPNMLRVVDATRRIQRLAADTQRHKMVVLRAGAERGVAAAVHAWAEEVADSPWSHRIAEHVLYRLGMIRYAPPQIVERGCGGFTPDDTVALIHRGEPLAAPNHIREYMPMGGDGARGLPPRFTALIAGLRGHFRDKVEPDEYVILGSAAMAVRGIRDVEDLDVLVHPRAMARLGYAPTQERTVLDVSLGDVRGLAQVSPLLTPFYGDTGDVTSLAVFMTTEWWYGIPVIDISVVSDLKRRRGLEKDFEDVRALNAYVPQNPARGGAQ